jgi:hypothetical protein
MLGSWSVHLIGIQISKHSLNLKLKKEKKGKQKIKRIKGKGRRKYLSLGMKAGPRNHPSTHFSLNRDTYLWRPPVLYLVAIGSLTFGPY